MATVAGNVGGLVGAGVGAIAGGGNPLVIQQAKKIGTGVGEAAAPIIGELTPAARAQRKRLKADILREQRGELGISEAQRAASMAATGRVVDAQQAQAQAARGPVDPRVALLLAQQGQQAQAQAAATQAGALEQISSAQAEAERRRLRAEIDAAAQRGRDFHTKDASADRAAESGQPVTDDLSFLTDLESLFHAGGAGG